MISVNFGIDLGTTNSLIAKYDNGQVVLFKNPIGHKETLASVVAFRRDRILVGDKAREYLMKDSANVFGSFKRKMGTDEKYYVPNLDENVTPVELSTYVLKELLQFVHSGETPEAAVITIPASFDTMQSNATKNAGYSAGFTEVYLLQEPIAASLAYFNHNKDGDIAKDGYWLVYDLGGGTFDVALVEMVAGEVKVADHEGNNFLGGVDFDFGILEQIIIPEIVRQTGIENFEDELRTAYGKYEKLYYQLLYLAEEAKKELSAQDRTEIEFSAEIEGKQYDFLITLTRQAFEQIIAKPVEQTIVLLKTILQRNQLDCSQVLQLVLVGGSTFIPYVREQLQRQTGIQLNTDIDPTTAVAVGAAYYAANKYYEPKKQETNLSASDDVDKLLQHIAFEDADAAARDANMQVEVSYSKMSREEEEVLLVKVSGDYLNGSYRIVRADGGFDTGAVKLKSKFTEFLPLMPNVANKFLLRIMDENNNEIKRLTQEIIITQGQYSINGQPLPKDICIEVDDKENNTTKLELVFEKNSLLPQKKTLYREISKTIRKGDDDSIVINILEGDRYARPASNLTIGCIEISGKDLKSDLLKGSDIEIQISMSESRELSTTVFLVMTEQEYKNVFSISEKQIVVSRLKEQFLDLETEIRKTVKQLNYDEESVWSIQANDLLTELLSYKKDILKLKDRDKSDTKYIIADAVYRISQEFDKIGGNNRLENLRARYLDAKDYVEQQLPMADFEKEALVGRFQKLAQGENQLLRTRNASLLQKATEQMNKLGLDILYNTTSFLISKFEQLKSLKREAYKNYSAATAIFKMADKALEKEKYVEFRQHVYNLTHLLAYEDSFKRDSSDFKGTGIG